MSGKRERIRRVKEKIEKEAAAFLGRSTGGGVHLDGLRGEMLLHQQVPSASAKAMSGQVAVFLLLKFSPDWFCFINRP